MHDHLYFDREIWRSKAADANAGEARLGAIQKAAESAHRQFDTRRGETHDVDPQLNDVVRRRSKRGKGVRKVLDDNIDLPDKIFWDGLIVASGCDLPGNEGEAPSMRDGDL